MRTHASALVLCALTFGSVPAALATNPSVTYKSCNREPSENDIAAAKGLFLAGKVSYDEADYPKAIQLWRDAFERDCTANLLLQNLANAYEKAGNIQASIVSLETYLARNPKAPDAPTIQKRIENMKKAATTSPPSSAAPTAPPPTHSATDETPPTTTSSAPTQKTGSRPITPLFIAGGGGVVTILGVITLVGGMGKVSEAEDACPVRDRCPKAKAELGNEGRIQTTIGGIITGVGAAGIAGGLAWYFLGSPEPQGARILTPALAPGYAGFSLAGRF